MLLAALVPLGIGVGLAAAMPPMVAQLRPAPAARVVLTGMIVSVSGVLATLGLLAWFALAAVPPVAAVGRWRGGDVVAHADVPLAVSLVAAAALCSIVVRVVVAAGRHLGDARDVIALERRVPSWRRPPRLIVVHDSAPIAHAITALPGCGGHIAVSTGLWDQVRDGELRRAVLEHERAHLRHRHGLLLAVAAIAVVVNPLLRRSLDRLRFTVERWADEDAARSTSRATVAEAVATVALADRSCRIALAFDGATSAARIEALLEVPRWRRAGLPIAIIGVLVGGAATATVLACHSTELLFEALRTLRTG